MRVTLFLPLFLIFTFCSPVSSFAASDQKASAWLSLEVSRFHFEEFDGSGKKLLTEKGYLPGVRAGFDINKRMWFMGGEIDFSKGVADYQGQTNTGTPITTRTDEEIVVTSITVGRWLVYEDRWKIGVDGGIGHRWWWRDIRAVGQINGISETYTSWFWFIGPRVEYDLSRKVTASLSGQLLYPINPQVEAQINNRDAAYLEMKEKVGYSIAATFRWQWTDALRMVLLPSYTFWQFERSPTKPLTWHGVSVGTVYEPDSETRIGSVSLSLVHTF